MADSTPPASPETNLAPGVVLGNYLLTKELAQGGLGTVYQAEHIQLGRLVALKILQGSLAADKELVARFFDEARAASQIEHENIIAVADVVEESAVGVSFIVMELLQGEDLRERLLKAQWLKLKECLGIAHQTANALRAAHAAGIVHRGLKPENVFLVPQKSSAHVVKLLDFGAAQLCEQARERATKQQPHRGKERLLVGTPAYMSPEQCLGRPTDHRTDIYSFGIILYEMLTGSLPYEAGGPEDCIVQHTTVAPVKPSETRPRGQVIPLRLERLLLRCLAKDPQQRPGNMAAILGELRAVAHSQGVPLGKARGGWSPVKTFLVAATTAVAAGLVTGFAYALSYPAPAPGSTRRITLMGLSLPWPTRPTNAGSAPGDAAAPPPLARVTITFGSQPPGVEVVGPEKGPPLGTTPCNLSLGRRDGTAAFLFRKAGFQEREIAVSLEHDGQVEVTLVPIEMFVPPRGVKPSPTARRRRARRQKQRQGRHRAAVRRAKHGQQKQSKQRGRDEKNARRAVLDDPFAQ